MSAIYFVALMLVGMAYNVTVGIVLTSVLRRCGFKRKEKKNAAALSAVDASPSPSPSPPTADVPRRGAALTAGYPSALVAIVAFAMDGAVGAGTMLVAYTDPSSSAALDTVAGCAALLVVAIYVAHVLVVTTVRFPAKEVFYAAAINADQGKRRSNLSKLE